MVFHRVRLLPLTYSVLCHVRKSKVTSKCCILKHALNCTSSYSTDIAPPPVVYPEYYASKHFWKVHELVSQGQYAEALETWDQQKASGETDKYVYTALMRLASVLKSAEAAKALKADMSSQYWEMDSKCTLHYVSALVADNCKDDAFDYICQSPWKDQPEFLTSAARRFYDQGESELALKVCGLGRPHDLLAVQLEVLGHLQNVEEMEELVTKHYKDITKAPVEVQLGMAFGLSLTNMPKRSLEVVSGLLEGGVTLPPKCIALMLEACKRMGDPRTAAEVYQRVWHTFCTMEPSQIDFTQVSVDFSLYFIRAMNAAIHLQAMVLRDLESQEQERTPSPEERILKAFGDHDFVAEFKRNALLPDQATYEAVMFHSCFQPKSKSFADMAIKTCTMTGREMPASVLTSWTKYCGPLTPKQAKQMLKIVRIHCHLFEISLGVEQISDLLSINYTKGLGGQLQKETMECIRSVKNLMRANPSLISAHLYNDVLVAIARTGDLGALYTTYKEMIVDKVPANARTYHALLDCCLTSGKKHAGKGAAYYTWRNLVKEFPAIELDVELLNKFIECCVLCRDHERALFFLSVFDESKLQPNIKTFQLLMKACRDGEQQEKFQVVVDLAQQCLPQNASELGVFAAEVEREWKNARDLALAEQILASQLRSSA